MKDKEKFDRKLYMEWVIIKTLFIAIVSAIGIYRGCELFIPIISICIIDFVHTKDCMKD